MYNPSRYDVVITVHKDNPHRVDQIKEKDISRTRFNAQMKCALEDPDAAVIMVHAFKHVQK